jgi:hypothetical protein
MLLSRQTGFKNRNALGTQAISNALPDNTPLEFRVLLSACRVFLGTEEPAKLEALLSQGPEWERLLTLSNRHGLMPLLYRSISQNCPPAVPAEWLARLRMQYMMNAARNMKMTAELLRILQALEKAGIKPVPLKGPVLAEQLYGDVALRQFSDLDILVPRKDADKALTVLEEKGYRSTTIDPRKERSKKKRAALLRSLHHYVMMNESSRINIELHWQLSPKISRLNTNEAAIWDRLHTVRHSNKELLSLSSEDYLVFLCQHGARHLWKRLTWLCDVSALIINNSICCPSVLKIAKEAKNEKVLILGILLAENLMSITIPEEIINGFEIDKEVTNLSHKIIESMVSFQDSHDDSFQLMADQILYKDFLSFREKAAFYIDLSITPTKTDFDLLPLPDVLFSAYKLVRPARLMKEYGEAFKKRLKGQRKE